MSPVTRPIMRAGQLNMRWNDATCTAPKTCSVCKITEGSALGHKYETTWSKDADKHWHKCSVCGDKTNEEIHSWDKGTMTIQPGCTTAGTKTFGCICGATKTENIDAAGHTAGAAVRENEVAATCTTDGSYDEVVYCADCRKELSREKKTVDALGHDCVHHNAKAATCTEKGWEAYDTCSRCDYTTYKETPAKGHSKGDAKRKRKLLQPVLQMAAMTKLYIVLSAKLKSAERAKPLRLQDTVLVHGQL